MSAADAEVLFRTAKKNNGGKDEDEARLYSEGSIKCGRHTISYVINNGQLPNLEEISRRRAE